jgi:DNA invertase Pin-like site-specific DNA recombinase
MAKDHSTPVRAAAYYRKSTPKQEDSIERQQSQVRPYAAALDAGGNPRYYLVGEYVDRAIAGDVYDGRPDFQRLLRDAKAGLFSVILTDEWERLSRQEPVDFIAGVVKPLRDAGVTLVTVADGPQRWDDLASLILATVRADKASGESKRLSRRVLSGMALFARQGRVLGPAPYGYKTEYQTVEEPGRPANRRPARYVPDPATAHVVRWLFAEYATGRRTLGGLCAELNARGPTLAPPPARRGGRRPGSGVKAAPHWAVNSLRSILRNPKYTGQMTWNRCRRGKHHRLVEGGEVTPDNKKNKNGRNKKRPDPVANDVAAWEVIPDKHEALVSQEVFDAVQARLRDHRKGGRGPNLGSYLFSGLCVCGHCGRTLYGVCRNGVRQYRCLPADAGARPACRAAAVREGQLLQAMLTVLEQTFLDPSRQEKLLAEARAQLAEDTRPEALDLLRDRLADLEAKIARGNGNLLLLPPERVPIALKTLKAWESERDRLRTDLAERDVGQKVVDLEETFSTVREWLFHLRDLAQRLDEPDVLPLMRDVIVAGVCRISVRWEHRRRATKAGTTRHIPVGGTLYLRDASGRTPEYTVFTTDSGHSQFSIQGYCSGE